MRIGIYQVYWGRVGGGQRYIGVVAQVLAARSHQVEIIHHDESFDVEVVQEALDLDLSGVRFRCVPPVERPAWTTSNPLARLRQEREHRAEISRPYDLFLDSSDIPPLFCHAPRGALIVHFPLVDFAEFHGHRAETWRQRRAPLRWAAAALHRWEWRQRLGSYDLFVVNSDFSRRWLERLWGPKARVLNPPLRDGLLPGPKEPFILSIGAFRAGAHKKHGVTIDVFKTLCDQGVKGWRYVLVGACGSNQADQRYLNQLRQQAQGYPIEFLADLGGDDLRALLGRASAFWHGMGYEVDERATPGLMEHFGMVVAESMACGTVPFVFNGGGLREIVEPGRTGFLWSTPDELADFTRAFVADPAVQVRLSAAARDASRRYSTEAFAARLLELLDPVLR